LAFFLAILNPSFYILSPIPNKIIGGVMNEETLGKYREAGKINREVREAVLQIIKPGMKILDLAEFIEKSIEEKGAKLAFPPNISINEMAAHYTPQYNDPREIHPEDIVKIDIGVRVDGYIADSAFSYSSSPSPLLDTSDILEGAIAIAKPGVKVSELGKTIQDYVKSKGLGLIVNLTGHTLDKDMFHGAPSIPNFETKNTHSFEEGDVIALEPFIVKSNSQVKESAPTEIYRFIMEKPVRMPEARKILEKIKTEYGPFPFAKRWLCKDFSPFKVSMALRQLESAGALESYPVLKDVTGQKIVQWEHTIIVSPEPIVTTK
jgi:methionyl aminopeptidase